MTFFSLFASGSLIYCDFYIEVFYHYKFCQASLLTTLLSGTGKTEQSLGRKGVQYAQSCRAEKFWKEFVMVTS